ncbi:uncharacterized protein LOC111383245 [Olea europaea var. sylvestris]|uniref:uncharacterized protein LOC111383245 n=1 Tax=Olea europaea var. sylvestris TaxID=158386 RepID=UPI000C1CF445|nr:uncharacterized protein LOC111383245 [Olea europaea var. sylvestris]
MKGVMRFGKKGKLSPRYIDPFSIIERIENVAYKLDLPSSVSQVHNVFHVSMLREYIGNPSHVLRNEPVEIKPDLTYEEKPIEILQREIKQLRSKKIPLVKVLWQNQSTEEATWKREDEMRVKYPELFDTHLLRHIWNRLREGKGQSWLHKSTSCLDSSCLRILVF